MKTTKGLVTKGYGGTTKTKTKTKAVKKTKAKAMKKGKKIAATAY